jgi:hypothetical protein
MIGPDVLECGGAHLRGGADSVDFSGTFDAIAPER